MRFLIYGAGALGQAIGCMFSVKGHSVDLVLRSRFIETIAQDGLRVSGLYGEYHSHPGTMGLFETVGEANGGEYDFVLLTTKAYTTSEAVADIGAQLSSSCPVISLQNGCGNIEQLVAAFGHERTLGGRVITGFEVVEPGHVKITVSADAIHIGGSQSGDVPKSAQLFADALAEAGLPCVSVKNVYTSLYAKLLYNCALNPLGAILGVHYGALADNPETCRIMDQVIEETFAVIEHLGGETPWKDATSYRELFYGKLVPMTAGHRPSMLQDLENKKPTEVDALVGYVRNQGERLGVPTPTCDVLASLVRFKEDDNRSYNIANSINS
jgi:2-dehydropantoate 2-reductase